MRPWIGNLAGILTTPDGARRPADHLPRHSGFALMLSAGQAVAKAAIDLVEQGRSGGRRPRNNGGDGFVAAANWPRAVARSRSSCVRAGQPAGRCGPWRRGVGNFRAAVHPQAVGRPALIIRLRCSCRSEPAGEGRSGRYDRGDQCNGAPVLSVDLPMRRQRHHRCGHGRRGPRTETVTFFRRKPAHLLLPGRVHCGRVRSSISGSMRMCSGKFIADLRKRPAVLAQSFPVPQIDGHKYARGPRGRRLRRHRRNRSARCRARCLRGWRWLVTLAYRRETRSPSTRQHSPP